MVLAAKGGIKNGARKGAHLASAAILYNSRGREPSTRPGGISRSRTEPWQPRAKGPAAGSTLTPVRACQPSGILESTAPPTGIYQHLNHLRFLPRSFAGAQDDVGGRGSPATKGGMHFRRPQGGCKCFIIRGRLLSIHRRPTTTLAPEARQT